VPINDRNLVVGTKLVATYKKQRYVCEVVQTEEALRYRVEGTDYKSPSAAGSAVLGGMACNGWRFWSLEGEAPPPRTRKPKDEGETGDGGAAEGPRRVKVLRKLPNQRGTPEGQAKWYCTACADGFLLATGETPSACPKGHSEADPTGDGQPADLNRPGEQESQEPPETK
jgi:hypothetical protein